MTNTIYEPITTIRKSPVSFTASTQKHTLTAFVLGNTVTVRTANGCIHSGEGTISEVIERAMESLLASGCYFATEAEAMSFAEIWAEKRAEFLGTGEGAVGRAHQAARASS